MRLLRRLTLPLVALFVLVIWPLRRRARRRACAESGWVELRLTGDIIELRAPRDVAQAFVRRLLKRKDPARVVLSRVRRFVDEVISDSFAKGVLVRVGSLGGGWAAAASLRRELQRLREAGRHVVVHLEGNVDNRQAMVAAVGTRVLMTPTATMAAAGVSVPGLFLRETLAHAGIQVEAIGHGKYKSAPDQLTRTVRSEADAEQTQAIVDQFDNALVESLMAGRVLNRADAEALVDRAPMIGQRAAEAGFCDAVARDEDLGEVIRAVDERETPPRPVGAARYLRQRTMPAVWPRRPRHVGVVRVHGPIIDEEIGVPLPDQQFALSGTVVDDLRAALSDSKIAAVVLHVNSRGGSVTASDAIYAAAKRLDQEKPVIACFGDVAASGGYYVGCGARSIFASPLTLTGSIGVFGILPTWPALTERLAVGHDVLKNRKNAAMIDPWAGLSEEARAHAQREVTATYEQFVALVAENRELSRDEVDGVAQGRVWTGHDARQHRLLDDLGGFAAAVEQAKAEAGGDFHDDPIVVSAKGPQARPNPFDPEQPTERRRWLGSALLDGDSAATVHPAIRALASLGLGDGADAALLELAALAWATRGARRTLVYAPVTSPA